MELDKVKTETAKARDELTAASSLTALTDIRYKYLGKKGSIAAFMRDLSSLPQEERPAFGAAVNNAKKELEELYELLKARFENTKSSSDEAVLDQTLPGVEPLTGGLHPITILIEEIEEVFKELGFEVICGPDIETEYYNFDALNVPRNHPARDMHDTFYLETPGTLLRTHTSNVQIRVMERYKPPVRIISPGRCYRNDAADATHAQVFHQAEGLYVDKGVTFSDLKFTLEHFAKKIFSSDTKVRFRPSFFPFTEPSAEYDVSCIICGGSGCRVCKGTGWLEISGAGMVNPAVFEYVGYPSDVSGFAFGMGIERIAMIKYGIADIRNFMENDIRFLRQFP